MNLAQVLKNHQYRIEKDKKKGVWVLYFGLYETEDKYIKTQKIFEDKSLAECYAFLKCTQDCLFRMKLI